MPRPVTRVYEPMKFGVLRAAALPVEAYAELGGDAQGLAARLRDRDGDPRLAAFAAAVECASGSLWDAVAAGDGADAPAAAALLRYFVRMTMRPTPFGLFAGVALVGWGRETDVSLVDAPARVDSRVDMAWLARAARRLEADPELAPHLPWVARSNVVERGGRLFLALSGEPQRGGAAASVRAAPLVTTLLGAARLPTALQNLLEGGRAAHPDIAEADVARVLDQLRALGFLRVQALPPLTGADPATATEQLLDRLPPGHDPVRELRRTLERARANDGRHAVPRHTDLAWDLGGATVARAVGREAARAADLLVRITPVPDGPWRLEPHRRLFQSRYGDHRRVPILELLDPETGIGWPAYADVGRGGPGAERRSRVLSELATRALDEGATSVELTDELVERLSVGGDPHAGPPSLEINVLVGAESAAALDRGDFTLAIGPNLGALAAGRSLGRFASLLGEEAIHGLEAAARAEEETEPDALWAEIVYWPARDQLANVVIRPAVRSHEVGDAATPGAPGAERIPVDELVVGVEDGRFVLEWPRGGRRVIPCTGHMLNYREAPALIRCLSEIGADGRSLMSGFGWGSAALLPALPRVTRGRVVLSYAQWRIDSASPLVAAAGGDGFASAVARWRERWRVPRLVHVGTVDNRLALDLEVPAHRDELARLLRRRRGGEPVTVYELLPLPEDAWLEGPHGHHVAEIVVPLVRRRREPVPAAPIASSVPDEERLAAPGGSWLYLKAYGPRALQDDLLMRLRPLADEAGAALRTWHFIRYSDPEPHLRIRFAGAPEVLLQEVLPPVSALLRAAVADGTCARFSVETYDRELERFGGPAGIAIAETVFGIDTRATLEQLALARAPGFALDETLLAVLSVDELLGGLGLDPEARLDLIGPHGWRGPGAGAVFRARRDELRACLADRGRAAGDELTAVLHDRANALASCARRMENARPELDGREPIDRMRRAFIHLHLNRLVGPTRQREAELMDLLRRTRLSLREHPSG